MTDIVLYVIIAVAIVVADSSAVADRKRRKPLPPPTRRERWLSVRMSIGAALLAIAIVVGAVPLVFAIVYLRATDGGPNTQRDSMIVIGVFVSTVIVGGALYLPAERELRRAGRLRGRR